MEHEFNTQNVYTEAQSSLHIQLFLPLLRWAFRAF